MLRPFAHPVACCCMLLHAVGSCWAKFETGQTFEQTTPNIFLFCDRRGVAQQCWIFVHSSSNTRDLSHQVFPGKPQTAKCHVTTALRSRLQFANYVWTAGRASSGKWFTARFFASKHCTASRLKARTSFLYPFAMFWLDFWSRINELFLFFGRLKWWTSTWWKTWRHLTMNA